MSGNHISVCMLRVFQYIDHMCNGVTGVFTVTGCREPIEIELNSTKVIDRFLIYSKIYSSRDLNYGMPLVAYKTMS